MKLVEVSQHTIDQERKLYHMKEAGISSGPEYDAALFDEERQTNICDICQEMGVFPVIDLNVFDRDQVFICAKCLGHAIELLRTAKVQQL